MSGDVLELARELIRRPSVTPRDDGCQALIAERLAPFGFEAEPMRFGDVDNLWLRRGTAKPVLVFAGHTDVVPPGAEEEWSERPFDAVVDGDRLIGRGASDMKGSLAAMVTAAARFARTYPDQAGTLALLITSDEEGAADDGTLKVMERLAARGELFDWCVVGEPSSSERLGDTVRIGRRGSLSGIMTIRGVQGHVAYPLAAENPMHAFARFVAEISRESMDPGNAHFPPTSFQMVHVHSDAGAPNVVPGSLQCRFNFRYSTEWTAEALAERVEDVLKRLGVDYEIRWRVAGKPFLTPLGRLTGTVQQAVEEETGLVPELSTSGGTSDGRFIAPYGIDVVELGPLNATIHKVDEEVSIEDLRRLERIYFRIAELLLR
ncbi:MAG: succinyl-diaminopimelate desuccinylase [Gammaproteobacteria bacterium]|nr:succinyl-diaminopimelate desuccinylase [Gammaproteobacteria bacterium]